MHFLQSLINFDLLNLKLKYYSEIQRLIAWLFSFFKSMKSEVILLRLNENNEKFQSKNKT